MPEKQTVVVVGAGASKECGLPTGYELKEKIDAILDIRFKDGYRQSSGDHLVCEALRDLVRRKDRDSRDINPHVKMARRIREAMQQALSIDNFIDAYQGNDELEQCGKLAIVRAILEAEKRSLLYFDRSNIYNSINQEKLIDTWFNEFFQLLTQNCRLQNLETRLSSTKFIIFNYDRCVEHFLFHSLQTYFGITREDAAKLVGSIEIYHPYGAVGTLPWYGGDVISDFGAEPSHGQLVDLAGQIRTFTEGTDPESSDIQSIRDIVAQANVMLFLGFYYHRLNLDLIRPNRERPDPDRVPCYGTAMGISIDDCESVSYELSELCGIDEAHITLRNDLPCAALFREYWRGLSLA